MAVINDPSLPSNVARVGMGAGMVWTPQHSAPGPLAVGNGGSFRLSMTSGAIAAAIAPNSELFQFRFVTGASRVALVHRISVSAAALVAPTAAATLSLRATVARAWTVAGSGGARASLVGNLQKLRTTFTTSEVQDAGIATTSPLTAGTKTLDTQDIGAVGYSVGTGALTVAIPTSLLAKTHLIEPDGMGFPLVLANQEGFVIRTGLAGPAAMTWALTVDVAWSEVDAF